jgi:hypothetical protein
VTEHLPEQYEGCLTALDAIIKRAFEILESSPDNREKLQAMQLFKDTHLAKLELLSNATTIDSALNYIRNKQQQEHHEKRPALDSITTTTAAGNDDDDEEDSSGSSNGDSTTTTTTTGGGRQTIF